MEQKKHYKMFKAGKYWAFAAVAGFVGVGVATQTPATNNFPLMQQATKASADDATALTNAQNDAKTRLTTAYNKAINETVATANDEPRTVALDEQSNDAPTTVNITNDYGYNAKMTDAYNTALTAIENAKTVQEVQTARNAAITNIDLFNEKREALNVLEADIAYVSNGSVKAPVITQDQYDSCPELAKAITFETSCTVDQQKIQTLKAEITDAINNYQENGSTDFQTEIAQKTADLYANKRTVELRNAYRYELLAGSAGVSLISNGIEGGDYQVTAADAKQILDRMSLFMNNEDYVKAAEITSQTGTGLQPMATSVPAKVMGEFLINKNAEIFMSKFGADKNEIKAQAEAKIKQIWADTESNNWQTIASSNAEQYREVMEALPTLPSKHKNIAKKVTRTIHFVDKNGNKVADDVTVTLNFTGDEEYIESTGDSRIDSWTADSNGDQLEAYDVNKEIDSSKYNNPTITLNDQAVSSIDAESFDLSTMTAGDITENYVVTFQDVTPTPTPAKTAHHTKYVDEQGNTIAPEVDGDDYADQKTIDGYTFKSKSTDDQTNTETYVYTKDVTPAPAKTTHHTKYVDENGKEIADEVDGDNFADQKTIDGYTFKSKSVDGDTETYVYTKNTPNTPNNNGGNGGDNTPSNNNGGNNTPSNDNGGDNTPSNSNDGKNTNGTNLPTTGGNDDNASAPQTRIEKFHEPHTRVEKYALPETAKEVMNDKLAVLGMAVASSAVFGFLTKKRS